MKKTAFLKDIAENIQPAQICSSPLQQNCYFIGSEAYIEPKNNLTLFKTRLFSYNYESKATTVIATAKKRYSFLSLSNNAQFIATGYKSIEVFDTSTFKKGTKIETKHKREIHCAAFSTNNQLLVTGSKPGPPKDDAIKITDLKTGKLLRSFKTIATSIIDVQFDDQDNILALDHDQNFYKWSMDGTLLHSIAPQFPIKSTLKQTVTILFHGKILYDKKIVVSIIEGYLNIWSLETGALLKKSSKYCKDATISDDLKTVFCIDFRGYQHDVTLEV